jgi:hypothetical protein
MASHKQPFVTHGLLMVSLNILGQKFVEGIDKKTGTLSPRSPHEIEIAIGWARRWNHDHVISRSSRATTIHQSLTISNTSNT